MFYSFVSMFTVDRHNREWLTRYSASHNVYSPSKYTQEMRSAMKVKTGKTKAERIEARINNIHQRNKYSNNFRSNISTLFVVLMFYGMISVPNFPFYFKTHVLIKFIILIFLAIICAFRTFKSAKIFRIGIYKKSNAIFVGIYTFIFFPLLIEAMELL